ncbi:MAG: nuclease [Alphaproteobacteria bacterium]|nr:nuclease [Alphaproteobacteria bacterium]
MRFWLIAICLAALPAAAWADPCEGALPRRAGETFSGQVRYIGDGDSLCVGNAADPSTWIEVRLADFNAPELHADGGAAARTALERLAMGQNAECVATRGRNRRVVSYDRVIATCRIGGHRIGDALRAAGAREGGN